ncbi:hypothetical protein [Microcoleus phage My-WqHQDG]|nr:hypothetical protein [Microcoleus phage My-WqHQDG]
MTTPSTILQQLATIEEEYQTAMARASDARAIACNDLLAEYDAVTIPHDYEGEVTYAVHPDYQNLFDSSFDPLSGWLVPNVPAWAVIRL